MTDRDSVKLRIISYHGWSVNMVYPVDDEVGYWMAVSGNNQVIGFTMEELFEKWTDHPEVLKTVLCTNIIRRKNRESSSST